MAERRWLTSSQAHVDMDGGRRMAVVPAPFRRSRSLPLLYRHRGQARKDLQFLLEGGGWMAVRLAADLLAALLASVIGTALSGGSASPLPQTAVLGFPLVVVAMLSVRGMYRRRVREVLLDLIRPVFGGVTMAATIVLAFEVTVHQDASVAPQIGRIWLVALVLVGAGRAALTFAQRWARARMHVGRAALIVGAGAVGAQIARRIDEHPEYGLRPIGYLDADPLTAQNGNRPRVPVLGGPDDLEQVVAQTGAQQVILAFSQSADRTLLPLVRRCDELGVEVSLVPRLFESINDRVQLERIGGLPLLALRAVDPKGWHFQVKYALDRPIAAVLLALLSPIMLLTALAVKLTSRGPILYRQRRVGRDGRVFDLLKFRSMHVLTRPVDRFEPDRGYAPGGVEGADRRTAIGPLLRRSAIDELPQLVNVLRGEMSLVGPRPERPEYVEVFALDHHRYTDRHRVKSGITGWAQVHGLRGQTSLADRVEWDNTYIENWSLWLDFKIILMTVGAVLRSGADA